MDYQREDTAGPIYTDADINQTDTTIVEPNFGQDLSQVVKGTDTFQRVQIDHEEDGDEEDDCADQKEKDGRNGVSGTALAIISTIMGGGIVSIPFAYAVAGIAVGVSVQICVIIAIWISCVLYLQTRTILRCNTSFSVIANLCLGPISGIILNLLLVFAVFGIMALYMILFSEIAISLVGDAYPSDHFLCQKTFYVCFLGLLISPIVIRKKIQELKMSTYILFAGVICLIVLLSALLFMNGSYDYRVEQGLIDESTVVKPVKPEGMSPLESVVDSINIAVASQGFVIALFPIYSSMARSARPHIMKSISGALLFTMSTYTYLSFISISYFGQANIAPSIFENIKQEEGISSILLRILFLLIFFCNIPFVFFAGKIALMAVIHQICYVKKPQALPQAATSSGEGQDDEFVRAAGINNEDTQPALQERSFMAGAPSDAAFSTSFISQSIKGEVRPEDVLPYKVYLTVCFSYLLIVALAAIFIDDLTLIFGIIAGLAECTTVFILPSIFYLVACHQERKKQTQYEELIARGVNARKPRSEKGGSVFAKFCVYIYLCAGVGYFFISNYFNFAKIFR